MQRLGRFSARQFDDFFLLDICAERAVQHQQLPEQVPRDLYIDVYMHMRVYVCTPSSARIFTRFFFSSENKEKDRRPDGELRKKSSAISICHLAHPRIICIIFCIHRKRVFWNSQITFPLFRSPSVSLRECVRTSVCPVYMYTHIRKYICSVYSTKTKGP